MKIIVNFVMQMQKQVITSFSTVLLMFGNGFKLCKPYVEGAIGGALNKLGFVIIVITSKYFKWLFYISIAAIVYHNLLARIRESSKSQHSLLMSQLKELSLMSRLLYQVGKVRKETQRTGNLDQNMGVNIDKLLCLADELQLVFSLYILACKYK